MRRKWSNYYENSMNYKQDIMIREYFKPHKIDTDLTAAYLRAIQQEIEEASESINMLMDKQQDWEGLYVDLQNKDKEIQNLKDELDKYKWHPAEQIPLNEERVIVQTKDGATFMLEPINGKWIDGVVKWMYIPQ